MHENIAFYAHTCTTSVAGIFMRENFHLRHVHCKILPDLVLPSMQVKVMKVVGGMCMPTYNIIIAVVCTCVPACTP